MKFTATVISIMTLFSFGFMYGGTVHADSGTTVSNPDDSLVLIDKERMLPVDYFPDTLVTPDIPISHEVETVKPAVADALEKMFAAAEREDVELFAVQGFRSYSYQESFYQTSMDENGIEKARRTTPEAGHSEHQTGLAIDVSTPEINNQLTSKFADTTAGQWVKNHAHEYGFIVRYPEGKEHITGYVYKPWHLRYAGTEAAAAIAASNLTLDEYLSTESPAQTHTIQPGDTLWAISRQYEGVSVPTLLDLNPGIEANNLLIGMKVNIGKGTPDKVSSVTESSASDFKQKYVVKGGDTLWSIANQYDNVTWTDLLDANPGLKMNFLQINQTIQIPASK